MLTVKTSSINDGSLIGYWKLDGNANDIHTNLLHGTPVNTPTWGTTSEAVRNSCVKMAKASSQYINLPYEPTTALFSPTQISISTWYYCVFGAPAAAYHFVSKRTNDAATWADIQWDAYLNSSNIPVFKGGFSGSTGVTLTGTAGVSSTGVWYHFVFTFDGTTAKTYRNGDLNGSALATGSLQAGSFPCVIGARANGASPYSGRAEYLDGRMDEIAIASRAWTADEVSLLWHSGSPLPYEEVILPVYGTAFEFDTYSEADTFSVTGASVIDSTHVRVDFDKAVNCVDPDGPNDVLNPDNWAFEVTGGVSVSPVSISVLFEAPTSVSIYLDKELTNGADYTVTASNIEALDGAILDVARASAEFEGVAPLPATESAEALTGYSVKIQFSKTLLHNSVLEDEANYTIDGPSTVTVLSATPTNDSGKTYVTLSTSGEMKNEGSYTVTVTDAEDLSENHITPDSEETFEGIGVAPRVLPDVIEQTNESIVIRFNELMNAAAGLLGSYSIDPALTINSVERYGDDYTYLLETATMIYDTDYTLTVDSAVTDLAGNPIDPDHDTVAFTGYSDSPPLIALIPDSGTVDYTIRSRVRVRFVDDTDNPTGINEASIWIKASFPTPQGGQADIYIVKDGALQGGFEGEKTGDPDDTEDGVLWSFIPKRYWLTNTLYTFRAYARDNEGTPNENEMIGTIEMGAATCVEDAPTTLVENRYDTAVWRKLARPICEKMRSLLLSTCSLSSDDIVRSRTLLYLAARADLQPYLAQYADLTLLSGVCLCDRTPSLELYQSLMPYKALLPKMALEVATDEETKSFILRYINSNSPPYVLAGVATAVIVAAMIEA